MLECGPSSPGRKGTYATTDRPQAVHFESCSPLREPLASTITTRENLQEGCAVLKVLQYKALCLRISTGRHLSDSLNVSRVSKGRSLPLGTTCETLSRQRASHSACLGQILTLMSGNGVSRYYLGRTNLCQHLQGSQES